jgi:GDP-mannose transporter
MVGALNKLPVALSGIMLEYARSTDFKVTPSSVISILVGFLAGVLYALAKNNEKKKAAAEAQTSELPLTNTSRKN